MALPLFRETQPPEAAQTAPPAALRRGARATGARICIRTFGCSHNASDSEHMAGQLAARGYALTGAPEDADLCIINSCTVKGPSQDSFLSLVRSLKAQGKPLLVAGCVPQADRANPELTGISMLGVQEIDRVVEAVEATLEGETVRLLEKSRVPSLGLPKLRRNPLVEIVPINLGCLGACTYCKTKHARGHLRSYAPADICARITRAIAQGVTQVWLTSEDCGAYGKDIGTDLPALLREIVALLPSHVMLRIGMANPPHIAEHLDAIAGILSHPQVFSFIHIPVQSGSDPVLRAMRREYTAGQFQHAVDVLREKVPGLCVATDIICGFPGESEEEFRATLSLVERNQFPVLNISQFYPRPGTPAARMRRIPTAEVKRRSTELTQLFRSQRPYDALVGTTQRVWISDISDDGQLIAHTKSYGLVLLPLDETLLGRSAVVRITGAGKHFVRGVPVQEP